jgi:hypothetical protein
MALGISPTSIDIDEAKEAVGIRHEVCGAISSPRVDADDNLPIG